MTRLHIISLLFILTSCGFHYKKYQTDKGQSIIVKEYNDDKKQERHYYRRLFKKFYKKGTYSKYSSEITQDIYGQYSYFQYDSSRIYIDKNIVNDSILFTSGLLYPRLFFCEINKTCIPIYDSVSNWLESTNSSGLKSDTKTLSIQGNKLIDPKTAFKKYGWTGQKLHIQEIKELTYLNGQFTRVFSIRDNYQHGGPTHHLFFIELTNKFANRQTNKLDFIRNSNVTYIGLVETSAEI